jgi:cytochrome c556
MMRLSSSALLFAGLLSLVLLAIVGASILARQSASTAATGIVAERMTYMEMLEDHSELLGAMVEGTMPLDSQRLEASAAQLAGASPRLLELFPRGSRDELSSALAVVWANWPEFLRQQRRFEAASEALLAATRDGEQALIRERYWEFMATCRDCHRGFRRRY